MQRLHVWYGGRADQAMMTEKNEEIARLNTASGQDSEKDLNGTPLGT